MGDQQLRDAVILAYGRSAIARGVKGSLKDTHPVDYAGLVLAEVVKKVPEMTPDMIEDVVVGCAKPEGAQGVNCGRLVVLRAGLPDSVPAQTVTRLCASGLQAIANGANAIMTGQAELVCAGGMESMTKIPMGVDPSVRNAWISENKPGLYWPMGLTAERVAQVYGISRVEMEQFAVESHAKAAAAREAGAFKKEIVPIVIQDENGNDLIFDTDEGIRQGTSLEKLAALKPSFSEDGRVTAGTASQVSDGAGFVVLASAEKARELGVKPLARFICYAVAGVPAEVMGIGPIHAIPRALTLSGLTAADLDVIELNEAFAAQAIPCIRKLKLDPEKINPRGGAIALGHPLGATGAILLCKALSYLEDTNGRYGMISMCIGGGMGAAGIIERL